MSVVIFYYIHRMVQKGGQTIPPTSGFFSRIFQAATKIFSSPEPTSSLGTTTTRPQALATPLQNSGVNPIGAPSKDLLSSASLKPSMNGGKRKRTRKNKGHLRKKRTFRR